MNSRRCGEEGFVFILAMIALVVLLAVGVVSLQLAMQSAHRAAMDKESAVAFNLAEAGADAAEVWLRAQSSPPTGGPFYPLGSGQTTSVGSYNAVVTADYGNVGAWQKGYVIIATGTATGHGITKQVVMRVQQQSFALYAYFTDEERSSVSNGTIWFYSRDRLYGPVHSNDQFHIAWDSTSADPIFHDTVSSSSTSVDWSPRAPRSTSDWRRVLEGGSSAMTLGTDTIALPTTSDLQKIAAWGAESGYPTSKGVYVPAAGTQIGAGIYVYGDCTVALSAVSSTGAQVFTVVQSSKTTTITVDYEANTTTVVVSSPKSTTIYSGVPNGAFYCTGNITSLSGTLANNYENGSSILHRNAWTIATDVAAGKDITITDSLEYQTEPDSTKPATHNSNLRAPTLGLVGDDVVLASGCPNEMTLDAVVLADGSFYYAGYSSVKRNDLCLLGGVIQRQRGPVGTFSSSNVHVSGYNKDYTYDPRMVDNPPPFFPTTGQFDVKSWQYK